MTILKRYLVLAGFLLLMLSFWKLIGAVVGPRLQFPVSAIVFFGVGGLIKWLAPHVSWVQSPSWLEWALTLATVVIASFLIINPEIEYGWIAAFGLLFVYGIVRLIIIARRGDGSLF